MALACGLRAFSVLLLLGVCARHVDAAALERQVTDGIGPGGRDADAAPAKAKTATSEIAAGRSPAKAGNEDKLNDEDEVDDEDDVDAKKTKGEVEEREASSAKKTEAKNKAEGAEKEEKKDDDDGKVVGNLSAGVILAIAAGAIVVLGVPLLLCFFCGCCSWINLEWLNRTDVDYGGAVLGGKDDGVIRSASKKSVDCRNSECNSFHVEGADDLTDEEIEDPSYAQNR